MNIAIKTKTKKEYSIAVAYLYAQGFKFSSIEFKDLSDNDLDFQSYPIILLNTDDEKDEAAIDFACDWYTSYGKLFHWSKDFDVIVKELNKPKKVTCMQLTEDYDADITDGGIVVGCQTISFKKFDELVKLVESYKKD